MAKPLLIFDGDCGLCRKWIERWQRLTGDRVDYAPYQEVGSRFPQISTNQFEQAVQLVEADGSVKSGAYAVFSVLANRSGLRWLCNAYEQVPGVRQLSEAGYRVVARNRRLFSRIF